MPAAFDSILDRALTPFYVFYGVAGVFTFPGGVEVAGTIRIHRNESSQTVRDSKVTNETQTAEILARKSEFPKLATGGRFLVDGFEIWTVEKAPLLKNGQWTVTCTRSATERNMEGRAKNNA